MSQVDAHGGRPHARRRQPLAEPIPTTGAGSAQVWRPSTPALAAGLSDQGWALREGVLSRGPPWPQPQVAEDTGCVAERGRVPALRVAAGSAAARRYGQPVCRSDNRLMATSQPGRAGSISMSRSAQGHDPGLGRVPLSCG